MQDSLTTPLRIVTNSSLTNKNAGLSPNQCMEEGPNALSSLLEVVIGFRMQEVGLVYDMSKAYQSIATGDIEKHVRRIVWRWCDQSADWEILAYRVVTFGDQIAGLVLELVKKLAAELGRTIDSEACDQILYRTYVDDGAGGGSRCQVERFRGKLVNGSFDGTLPTILGLVGLSLKVMVASGDNDPELLKLLGDKVLGHTWRPTEDKLVFKVTVNLSTSKTKGQKSSRDLNESDIPRLPTMVLTRRMLLAFVMSQYDPLGLICPLTIKLKILLRCLYGPGTDLGWDDQIPKDLHVAWVEILTMFLQLGEIVLDRAVKPENTIGAPELVGFADGSLEAYACAIYVRWKLMSDTVGDEEKFHVRLVCGKARVTPAKGTTAPRSELSGFLILTRLLKVVWNAMDFKPCRITMAVDSQCTISAMEKVGGLLAPFFASRVSEASTNVSELSEGTLVDPLLYVPGLLNPADIPTRGSSSGKDVQADSIWQSGPEYLSLPRYNWPFSRDFLDYVPEQELRPSKVVFHTARIFPQHSPLGLKLTTLALQVMERTNCLSKAIKSWPGFLSVSLGGTVLPLKNHLL